MGTAALGNLQEAASAAKVAPERLIVAPYVPDPAAHVARLAQADVFLDTLPYNAHSSAAEALWAGVPVVSCCGKSFAGRVSASVATAGGVPDLISADIEDYRRLALQLATHPAALREVQRRIGNARRSAPLFDMVRYTRALEELLLQARAADSNRIR
jgi:predicted O-linked N-acetylglucosamine transferase (SPINDLY family)